MEKAKMANTGRTGAHAELDAHENEYRSCFTTAERSFVEQVRAFRMLRVGYGFMRQIIGWEWKAEIPTLYHDDQIVGEIAVAAAKKEWEVERGRLNARLAGSESLVMDLYLAIARLRQGADVDDNKDVETMEEAWCFLPQKMKDVSNEAMKAYDAETAKKEASDG
jgi:hypothetical protein